MSDELNLTVASTTDKMPIVEAVARGDEDAARVPPPSTYSSYENPQSERRTLLARLDAEEKGLTEDEATLEQLSGAEVDESEKSPEPLAENAPKASEQPSSPEQPQAIRTDPRFLMRAGQLAIENPEGVQALASSKLEIPPAVLAELGSDPAGADLAVHLAQNPDVAEQLRQMPLSEAVRQTREALGVLKYQAANPQPAPPARKAISNAPAPIRPVGGSATRSSVPIDETDFQTFRNIRDQQEKQRYRR
jgi:hypothetical protein